MASSDEAEDLSLVEGTLAGRQQDFDLLVRRYQRMLYAFAYRLLRDPELAADVVQSTFVLAYTRLAQFARRSTFKTWLHQIALNECRAARRKTQQSVEVAIEDVTESRLNQAAIQAGDSDSPGWRAMIEHLIARLPPRQRSVLTLRIFSDLAFKEIAAVERITENSAKVNFHHAITRLRAWIEEEP